MHYKIYRYYFFIVFTALVLYGCANMGSLTGGQKDVVSPEIVESKPANRTINYTGKRIQLTFNEFIQLKDISKNFVVSPPMKKAPVILPKPRDIIVNFEEEFKPNTTYTLYFGNSIGDYNEGNPIRNFNFVFSTGNYIDSLSFLGRIYNAFDRTPQKDGMYVMMYALDHDSIPRKSLPAFITKSNEKGWFKFDNIYADTFLVFGLKDANMNYLFDNPGEIIAFSDSLVVIDTSFYEWPDTLFAKKIVLNDSIPLDSIDEYAKKTPQLELYFFKEEIVRKQNLSGFNRIKNNRFNLFFENPVQEDSLHIELLGDTVLTKWFIRENILLNDTLDYWITDTTIVNIDTLKMRIGYYTLDSLQKTYLKYDTISIILKKGPAPNSKRKQKQTTASAKLTIQSAVSSNTVLELNNLFYVDPDQPIKSINLKKILLSRMEDTLKIPVKYTLSKDSVLTRRYYLNFPYESDSDYELIFDTASFTSIYGVDNDSVGYRFKTQRDDYYGTIKLTLKNIKGTSIVQLITPKGDIVKEKIILSNGLINFDFLAPGKYGLKIIYDKNNNGQWDTGNWAKKLQPEKVLFYTNEISVRSNWDVEVNWELP